MSFKRSGKSCFSLGRLVVLLCLLVNLSSGSVWALLTVDILSESEINARLVERMEWADMQSYIPYEGQVDVLVKKSCILRIRIPEWVSPDDVNCIINGKRRKISWDSRYASIGKVKPKDNVSLTFPISERTVEGDIEKQHYVLTLKGNEVVNIYPPGRFCPLYQREHYRQNAIRWKEVE